MRLGGGVLHLLELGLGRGEESVRTRGRDILFKGELGEQRGRPLPFLQCLGGGGSKG